MIADFDWIGECRLRHRGPDWSGLHCHQDCYLAHQRLAIVDPTSGDQPLYNEDKTVIVTVCMNMYIYSLWEMGDFGYNHEINNFFIELFGCVVKCVSISIC